MKKQFYIAFLIVTFFVPFSTIQAQHYRHDADKREQRPDITELVSDLSSSQKRKIDAISSESKSRVDKLRKQQKEVRDSIGIIMEREGDQSKIIYTLFDREARLQVQISREMYSAKVQIDQILTAEQRQELQKCKHQRLKKKK